MVCSSVPPGNITPHRMDGVLSVVLTHLNIIWHTLSMSLSSQRTVCSCKSVRSSILCYWVFSCLHSHGKQAQGVSAKWLLPGGRWQSWTNSSVCRMLDLEGHQSRNASHDSKSSNLSTRARLSMVTWSTVQVGSKFNHEANCGTCF